MSLIGPRPLYPFYLPYYTEKESLRHSVRGGITGLQSVDTAVEMNRAGDYGIPVPDYIEENVSSKVVKIIQSYTGVVNKMVGTALVNNLRNIRDNKNRTRPNISIEDIYEYDLDSTPEELDRYCQNADFVFNLAGVNRPENPEDFMRGNFGFASQLLETLKKYNKSYLLPEVDDDYKKNDCPIALMHTINFIKIIKEILLGSATEE